MPARRRRLDAREQLYTGLNLFEAMGMDAFARRAERELSATGERARKRIDETRAVLTPQEAQIASLARDGLSNAEIATRLFLTARTSRMAPPSCVRQARNQLAQAAP